MDKLKNYSDARGDLFPIEFSSLPFIPIRSFIVKNVPKDSLRGGHAHYKTRQLLICLKGKIKVLIHDGKKLKTITLKENMFTLVDAMLWDSQKFLTNDDVLLVFCSTPYEKADYILDFNEFKKIRNDKND